MDRLFQIAILTVFAAAAWGAAADPTQIALSDDYQTNRLFTPSPRMLEQERAGRVFIYDSLDAREVDAAMDQHFERIQNMMFIRVRRLAPSNPEVVEVEDDGC
ncbi:hypothetical protein [Thiosocius teredinicola]|uniref:hypothetical protein n=1 Tax=Thiosocius teredinicola TaxID=1973002 RepID=UPI000990A3B1